MSGINGPGPKISGSYDQMRQGILGDKRTGEDDSKIIRGDNTGEVYLHHGSHNLFRWTEREEERNQGSENLFNALCQKLGGGVLGTQRATQIFTDIGLQRGGEFRIRDFQRIDDRVNQELGRLDRASVNWQEYVHVPDDLKYTRTWEEWGMVPDYNQGIYGDHNEYFKPGMETKSERRVHDDIDTSMRTQVRQRLRDESNGGVDVLDVGRIRQIIREEFARVVERRET